MTDSPEAARRKPLDRSLPESAVGASIGVDRPILEFQDVSFYYGDARALSGISFPIARNRITALIGPSGCGKSTLLRCLNRLNDLVDGARVEGRILLDGRSIHDADVEVSMLRKRIGMVFQKSNPFPKSIYDNVAYGPRIHGVRAHAELDEIVERSLRGAALWDEVKDRLRRSALALSGGQQQRLCIARAIAVEPEIILYDEPCSALDPVATSRIEDLMFDLKERYTQVIVTHNMQQAARVSDHTAFLYLGELVEFGATDRLFTNPREQKTADYIMGRFG
jgi:phosphate transport system ATP-binding protein